MLQPRAALTHEHVLGAFAAASDTFLRTVRQVETWEAPGLGEWTVRELVGHTLRAYTTIERELVAEPMHPDPLPDPTSYYRFALSLPDISAGVAARGREAGRALTDPVATADETARRVLAVVATVPGDRVINVFVGPMAFRDYLATRAVELTVHTLDIQVAIGVAPVMPEAATQLCLDVLAPLADDVDLLLGITGRRSLNVLG